LDGHALSLRTIISVDTSNRKSNNMAPTTCPTETRDQIHALLQREVQSYRCVDYMAHERPSVLDRYCNNILEECSNVVHDRCTATTAHSPTSTATLQGHMRLSDPPTGVIKVESSHSIRDVQEIDSCGSSSSSLPPQTFTYWRQQMFDWASMVVDGYGIEHETVAVSFNLLDRFIVVELSRPNSPPITRDDYQLFSMTCLYMSIKVLETFQRKLPVQTFVDMSKNYYTKEVIEATERDILQALDWYVHAPTGLGFARLFLQLLPCPVSRHMRSTIVTLTEIAVADSLFVACRPSNVGLAAVLHAARIEGLSDATMQQFQANLDDFVPNKNRAEFRMVYLQLEKLYYQ
jgi:Cyclin, N-terminal domain